VGKCSEWWSRYGCRSLKLLSLRGGAHSCSLWSLAPSVVVLSNAVCLKQHYSSRTNFWRDWQLLPPPSCGSFGSWDLSTA
jgi:hypothetical protein